MQARGETGGGDAAHTLHAPGPSQQLESAIWAIPRHSAAVGRAPRREGGRGGRVHLPFLGRPPRTQTRRWVLCVCLAAGPFYLPSPFPRPQPVERVVDSGKEWVWRRIEASFALVGRAGGRLWRERENGGREEANTRPTALSSHPLPSHPPPSSGSFNYGGGNPMRPHRVRLTHSLVENYDLPKMLKV
jgi:hypothetical protein